jgi:hypothetical protein
MITTEALVGQCRVSIVRKPTKTKKWGCRLFPTQLSLRIEAGSRVQDVAILEHRPERHGIGGIELRLSVSAGEGELCRPSDGYVAATVNPSNFPATSVWFDSAVDLLAIKRLCEEKASELSARAAAKVAEFKGWLLPALECNGYRVLSVTLAPGTKGEVRFHVGTTYQNLGLFSFCYENQSVRFRQRQDGARRGHLTVELHSFNKATGLHERHLAPASQVLSECGLQGMALICARELLTK